ncbi:MAG: hypothetical protein LBK50_00090 [Candidatus Nomurabacteria bacterium]|nr:hypothetical protein [Candidatus Nomurabacteria bacterium]
MTYKNTVYQSSRISARAGLRQNFAMNQNTIAYARDGKIGPVATFVVIGLLVVGMLMIYLMQLSSTGSYGYKLNDINVRQSELVAEQQDLEVDNARMQSLAAVKNSTVAASMTAPASTDSVN